MSLADALSESFHILLPGKRVRFQLGEFVKNIIFTKEHKLKYYFIFALISLLPSLLNGQDKLVVSRARAVDISSRVYHVAVDGENNKWVSTDKGLFKVKNPEVGEPVSLATGTSALYQFPGGNARLEWNTNELDQVLGNILSEDNTLSAAAYDSRKDILWIGTTASGAYELRTKPKLTLLSKINNSSKSGAAKVNALFIEPSGKTWIGTDAGVFYGSSGKWKQEQKYFTIQSIQRNGSDIWVLGDALLWKVSAAEVWEPVEIPLDLTDGSANAMAVDPEGRVWIASERMARFDPATGESLVFGPAEYYTTQFPTCIAIDLDGVVWIGSEDKGLYFIDKATAWRTELVLQKPLDCNSPKDEAVLNVLVNGGKPPFSYTWSNGTKGQSAANLGPGKYSVTISDADGAQKVLDATIPDTRIKALAEAKKEESAPEKKDGRALTRAEGGAPPYAFAWDNGEKSQEAVALAAGTHSVTVSDAKGCKTTAQVQVARQAPPITFSIVSSKPVSCSGMQDGAIEIAPDGGVKPYQIAWQNPNLKGTVLQNLPAGRLAFSITDSKGLRLDSAITIASPAPLQANISLDKPAGIGQADGFATANPQGGTEPFQFKWTSGETTPQAKKLPAGKATVEVVDAKGCKASASIEMTENILPMSATIQLLEGLKCKGGNTAVIAADVTGGKPPYRYTWSNPGFSGAKIGNLPAGKYSVTVQDASGKQVSGDFTLSEPDALLVQAELLSPASTNNKDGRAKAQASGGTPPYRYKWDNAEEGENAFLLGPGKRVVQVTDANGCKAEGSVAVSENILPLSIQISTSKPVTCAGKNDGVLVISVSGGKPPYTNSWDKLGAKGGILSGVRAGSYTFSVKDATGAGVSREYSLPEPKELTVAISTESPATLNQKDGKAALNFSGGTPEYSFAWDNGEKGLRATQLSSGKHSATVTDANGCQTTAVIDVPERIPALSVEIGLATPLKCFGSPDAALMLNINGGKAPFQYRWNDASLKGDKPSGLKAGVYAVTVSDVAGNTASAELEIKSPPALKANVALLALADSEKANGKARVQASGGTAPYTYAWDNGESTADATRLNAGKRQVTVRDTNGCSSIATIEIPENIQPLTAELSLKSGISCHGQKTAALNAAVKGGKPPYQLSWSNGKTGSELNQLGSGEYTLKVSDALGNEASAAFNIPEPPAILVELSTVFGAGPNPDGQATLRATGGSGGFTYAWSNSETTPDAKQLPKGMARFTVTDSKGCTATDSVLIPQRLIAALIPGKLTPGQVIQLEQIRFGVDSVVFTNASLPMVQELARFMKAVPGLVIEIGGHTSNLCSDEFCIKLSESRAKTVAEYLIRQGIDASRVSYKGYGKQNPIAPNTTPEGRQKNQRVELKILQIGNP